MAHCFFFFMPNSFIHFMECYIFHINICVYIHKDRGAVGWILGVKIIFCVRPGQPHFNQLPPKFLLVQKVNHFKKKSLTTPLHIAIDYICVWRKYIFLVRPLLSARAYDTLVFTVPHSTTCCHYY